MSLREIELRKLGFTANDDQRCYALYKYDCNWYVDYQQITDYLFDEWHGLIESIRYDLQKAKKEFYSDKIYISGRNLAEKEFKKKLKDTYNKYNSWLKQLNVFKLDKTVNQEARIRLEGKVEVLKELMNGK
jgi:hypothetical protein